MKSDENKKIEINVPESCPKFGNGAFYRMAHEGPWRCYFCDPPPVAKKGLEKLKLIDQGIDYALTNYTLKRI